MRNFVLAIIFLLALSVLCLCGCGTESCSCTKDSLTVGEYENTSCSSEDEYIGDVTLSGCHLVNSNIDCYWFPTACGYYENDLRSVSHVICGWDCTLIECYGDTDVYKNEEYEGLKSATETRSTTVAQEGVDYTIDKVTATIYYGEFASFADDKLDLKDFGSLLSLIETVGEEMEIMYTVEYTALTELAGVAFEGDVKYKVDNEYFDRATHFTSGFRSICGNTNNIASGGMLATYENLQPGKYVIRGGVSLDIYEVLALKDIVNIEFTAYKYVEG